MFHAVGKTDTTISFAAQDIWPANEPVWQGWTEWLFRLEVRGEQANTESLVKAASMDGSVVAIDKVAFTSGLQWLKTELSVSRLSINVSALSISEPEFTKFATEALISSGIEPSRICLEVTEHARVSRPVVALNFIKYIRNLGCLVAIDDFGSGFLHDEFLVPKPLIDILKIDRKWILPATQSPNHRAALKHFIQLAHEWGLLTVAEGCETAEHFSLVQALGADYAQGYIFSKPETQAQTIQQAPRELMLKTGAAYV